MQSSGTLKKRGKRSLNKINGLGMIPYDESQDVYDGMDLDQLDRSSLWSAKSEGLIRVNNSPTPSQDDINYQTRDRFQKGQGDEEQGEVYPHTFFPLSNSTIWILRLIIGTGATCFLMPFKWNRATGRVDKMSRPATRILRACLVLFTLHTMSMLGYQLKFMWNNFKRSTTSNRDTFQHLMIVFWYILGSLNGINGFIYGERVRIYINSLLSLNATYAEKFVVDGAEFKEEKRRYMAFLVPEVWIHLPVTINGFISAPFLPFYLYSYLYTQESPTRPFYWLIPGIIHEYILVAQTVSGNIMALWNIYAHANSTNFWLSESHKNQETELTMEAIREPRTAIQVYKALLILTTGFNDCMAPIGITIITNAQCFFALVPCAYVIIRTTGATFLAEFPGILSFAAGVPSTLTGALVALSLSAKIYDLGIGFLACWSNTKQKSEGQPRSLQSGGGSDSSSKNPKFPDMPKRNKKNKTRNKKPKGNLMPETPFIRMSLKETAIADIESTENIFMSPFHTPVSFTDSDFFGENQGLHPTCKWNFFGTEPCIPMLNCDRFQLMPPDSAGTCVDEYLEVFDGYKGLARYCGQVGPVKISAAADLRDLYINYKRGNVNGTGTKFRCTVTCSSREEALPLPMAYSGNVEMKCSCGTKNNDDRIVGGVQAEQNEFPWQVALVGKNTREPFCGGAIINDRMIVTAGHCFQGKAMDIENTEVLVNAHKLDVVLNPFVTGENGTPRVYQPEVLERLDRENGTLRFQLREVQVHPLFQNQIMDFDIAVVLLNKPINFLGPKKLARPICLPELGSYLRTFSGRNATIAGWGLEGLNVSGTPDILRKVTIQVFSIQEGKSFYGARLNRRMMCAGFRGGMQDSCVGDSGGPLILEEKGKVWYQIGVVSWGDGCAKANSPGVYSRTTEYGQWVHYYSNSNDAVWCKVPG